MKQTRLYFIDIVRAIAILMMLQGHFVDTLLDPQFRNDDIQLLEYGRILEESQLQLFLLFQV